MKFKISRTSDFLDRKSPCDEAFEEEYTTMSNELRTRYVININSLEELVELSKKYGDIIINEFSEIEIYDDYRE